MSDFTSQFFGWLALMAGVATLAVLVQNPGGTGTLLGGVTGLVTGVTQASMGMSVTGNGNSTASGANGLGG